MLNFTMDFVGPPVINVLSNTGNGGKVQTIGIQTLGATNQTYSWASGGSGISIYWNGSAYVCNTTSTDLLTGTLRVSASNRGGYTEQLIPVSVSNLDAPTISVSGNSGSGSPLQTIDLSVTNGGTVTSDWLSNNGQLNSTRNSNTNYTFTTSAGNGTGVIRFTASNRVGSAYVDVAITINNTITFINNDARTNANIFQLMGSPSYAGNFIFDNRNVLDGTGSSNFALRTGGFAAGSTLTIINRSYIRGQGGVGQAQTAGTAGLTALYIDDNNVTLDNQGYILGGGGGGGSGRTTAFKNNGNHTRTAIGAAGGAGAGPGDAQPGTAGVEWDNATSSAYPPGSTPKAGADGASGPGGSGGSWGQAGATGEMGYGNTLYSSSGPWPGGAGGPAIATNGHGINITSGNNGSQIQGSIT